MANKRLFQVYSLTIPRFTLSTGFFLKQSLYPHKGRPKRIFPKWIISLIFISWKFRSSSSHSCRVIEDKFKISFNCPSPNKIPPKRLTVLWLRVWKVIHRVDLISTLVLYVNFHGQYYLREVLNIKIGSCYIELWGEMGTEIHISVMVASAKTSIKCYKSSRCTKISVVCHQRCYEDYPRPSTYCCAFRVFQLEEKPKPWQHTVEWRSGVDVTKVKYIDVTWEMQNLMQQDIPTSICN